MPNTPIRDRIEEQGKKVKHQEKRAAEARRHGDEAIAHSKSVRKKMELSEQAHRASR